MSYHHRTKVIRSDGQYTLKEIRPRDFVWTPDGFAMVEKVFWTTEDIDMKKCYMAFAKDVYLPQEKDWLLESAYIHCAEFDGKKVTGLRPVRFPLQITREIIVNGAFIRQQYPIWPHQPQSPDSPIEEIDSIFGKMKLGRIEFTGNNKPNYYINLQIENRNNNYYANDLIVPGYDAKVEETRYWLT